MERKYITTDLLIIGGGTAGCYAAITAARKTQDIRILIAEKANIKRSGCLAAGVNALNAYITEGQTTRDYLEFVRWDAEKSFGTIWCFPWRKASTRPQQIWNGWDL